ncbi:MAG: VanZ family protein [Oscillospiraceae bacterium]|nr:VanZ family protein [Oscillospiraceae bacterium]
MYRFFLAAVDVVPAALVLLPLFWILYLTVYQRNVRKSILCCLYCLYLAAVFSLVGIPNVTYFRPDVNLNLIPFRGMVEDLKNGMLNVVLFVPLGFFLPVLWRRFRRPGPCLAFGFSLSLSIELLQLLTFRATDVNDLITNTLGTLLGFLMARRLAAKHSPAGEGTGEPVWLTALAFAVMFFAHPFLSPWLWDRIL